MKSQAVKGGKARNMESSGRNIVWYWSSVKFELVVFDRATTLSNCANNLFETKVRESNARKSRFQNRIWYPCQCKRKGVSDVYVVDR